MFNKMKEMTLGKARYTILKELDTRGPIGQLLLSLDPQMSSTMMNLCENLFEIDAWLGAIEAARQSGEAAPQPPQLGFDDHAVATFMTITGALPTFILLYSEMDWNTFCSALMTLVNSYVNVMMGALEAVGCGQEEMNDQSSKADSLMMSMDPVMKLMELGAGYEDLLRASNKLIEQMKAFNQSSPSPVRLSEAYLKSLGFYTKKEEEHP